MRPFEKYKRACQAADKYLASLPPEERAEIERLDREAVAEDALTLRTEKVLGDTLFNLLGTRDPKEVAGWISGAREEIANRRLAQQVAPILVVAQYSPLTSEKRSELESAGYIIVEAFDVDAVKVLNGVIEKVEEPVPA